jgi:hypothetical protein
MLKMIMIMTALFVSSIALAVDPQHATKQKLYFPTKLGTKWIYKWKALDDRYSDREAVEVISKVTEEDGAKIVTLSEIINGFNIHRGQWKVSTEGLLFSSRGINDQGKFSPMAFLKLPHSDGQKWDMGCITPQLMCAKGPERVKVTAGEFDAIRVEQYYDENGLKNKQCVCKIWFAPEVGIVKREMIGLHIELTSFVPATE